MKKHDDVPNLPLVSRRSGALAARTGKTKEGGFSAEQKLEVIKGGLGTVSDGMALARVIIDGQQEIARIKAQTHQAVSLIEAECARIEAEAAAMVEVMIQQRRLVETSGDAAAQVIGEITRLLLALPEGDSEARRAAIERLPALVELALR